MAGCEKCIHFEPCSLLCQTRTILLGDRADELCKMFMPTADVVPKSEVAKEFTCFVGDPHKVDHCPYIDEIEKAKIEVAREIFEEIEKLSHEFMNNEHYIFGDMLWDIAELKKKYTEGE